MWPPPTLSRGWPCDLEEATECRGSATRGNAIKGSATNQPQAEELRRPSSFCLGSPEAPCIKSNNLDGNVDGEATGRVPTITWRETETGRQRGPAIPLSQLSPAFQPLRPRHLTYECIILEIQVQTGTRMLQTQLTLVEQKNHPAEPSQPTECETY